MKPTVNVRVYKAREANPILRDNATAQAVGEELDGLGRKLGLPWNALTSDAIVEKARAIDSAMHGFFQWDDILAARNYRHQQANQLKQAIMVVVSTTGGESVEVPAFPSIAVHRGAEGSDRYSIPVQEVLDDADLRERYARKVFAAVYAKRSQLLAAGPHFGKLVAEMDRLTIAIGNGLLSRPRETQGGSDGSGVRSCSIVSGRGMVRQCMAK